jgi:hypothetical protein
LLVKDVRRETLEDARFALLADRERNKPIAWVAKLPNEAKSSSIYKAMIFLVSLPCGGRRKGLVLPKSRKQTHSRRCVILDLRWPNPIEIAKRSQIIEDYQGVFFSDLRSH